MSYLVSTCLMVTAIYLQLLIFLGVVAQAAKPAAQAEVITLKLSTASRDAITHGGRSGEGSAMLYPNEAASLVAITPIQPEADIERARKEMMLDLR